MDYEAQVEARRIAGKLMQELRDGKRTKIGIDEVREAIRDAGYERGSDDGEVFEIAVTRAVVEDLP